MAKANEAEVETDDQTVETQETEDKPVELPAPDAQAEDDVEHPDDQALREAREAVEAEDKPAEDPEAEAGDKPAAEAEPKPAGGEAQPDAEKPAAGAPKADGEAAEAAKPEQIMVPIERLNDVRGKLSEALLQNAYLKGVAETRAQQPVNQGETAEPVKSPEERLTEIHTEIDALALKFDDGEISMAEFKKQERVLESEAFDVRQAQVAPVAEPEPAAPASNPDLYLDQLTEQLERDHPYTMVIQKDDAMAPTRWAMLEAEAKAELAQEGVELIGDPRSVYELRRRMAEKTDAYGPHWYPDAQVGEAQPDPQPAKKPDSGLSPRAEATLNKVEDARNHPPDTLRGGSAESDEEAMAKTAEAQLARGDIDADELLEGMPERLKAKIRGSSWE